MMAQWHSCKEKANDAVLLFRMGDFYEAFYEDAALLSKELELTLTQRQGIAMAGIPFHAAEGYIDRLVCKGHKVAIAEQTEDPKFAKGLVKREIVRIVTPGSLVNSSLLSESQNNFFCSLCQVGNVFGLAALDLSTGELRVFETVEEKELFSELYRLRPSEYLIPEKFGQKWASLLNDLKQSYSFLLSNLPDWNFEHQTAYATLVGHLHVHSLDGYGMKGMVPSVSAAGALLSYIRDTLCLPIEHIRHIQTYSLGSSLSLDRITLRNLEITESLHDASKKNTLLEVLDETATPMGGRLIRQWLLQPLRDLNAISRRQDAIENFLQDPPKLSKLCDLLQQVRDLERLIMKVSTGLASPRDVSALRSSLEHLPPLKQLLASYKAPLLQECVDSLCELKELVAELKKALVDEPPLRLSDGNIFREGYHPELDTLRHLSRDGKSWLANYQVELREATGIKTLRVGFTQVFGYYIEVSKGQAGKMPSSFQRRQTLVNTERFISPALKEYEEKVVSAEDKMSRLESELFTEIRLKVASFATDIQTTARSLAVLDCLHSLAKVSRQWSYVRPILDESDRIEIVQGRHPVIEARFLGRSFTPNDTLLDDKSHRLLLITGPNMAGKSTYIRQVALICILAHMGSFVPAQQAHIGLLDKVFTRIGASDDLSRGQSTFMVEMTETANILHHATDKSLVILDEIGRGTSTYDGISIAWAVAEYLLTQEGKRAKTLFATHYWELTKLEEHHKGAINYTTLVQEMKDEILFLHKIVSGGTDKSYGVHVARLAGLPTPLLRRAREILAHLEENANRKELFAAETAAFVKEKEPGVQLLLFDEEKALAKKGQEVLDMLKHLNINEMTPIQAHCKLAEIRDLVLL